jgi:hypothetical protein
MSAEPIPLPDPVARAKRAADSKWRKAQEASADRDRARAEHTLHPNSKTLRAFTLAEVEHRAARTAWLKAEREHRELLGA